MKHIILFPGGSDDDDADDGGGDDDDANGGDDDDACSTDSSYWAHPNPSSGSKHFLLFNQSWTNLN